MVSGRNRTTGPGARVRRGIAWPDVMPDALLSTDEHGDCRGRSPQQKHRSDVFSELRQSACVRWRTTEVVAQRSPGQDVDVVENNDSGIVPADPAGRALARMRRGVRQRATDTALVLVRGLGDVHTVERDRRGGRCGVVFGVTAVLGLRGVPVTLHGVQRGQHSVREHDQAAEDQGNPRQQSSVGAPIQSHDDFR